VSGDDICNYFATSRSTTLQRAKLIRDMFKLRHWDKEFSTSQMIQNDPFRDLAMVNGFIVSIKSLPPELQELIR